MSILNQGGCLTRSRGNRCYVPIFPYEYSPDDFIKGSEPSIPRNPLIAEVLFRSEDIEKWGSGLRRISQECRAAGVKVAFSKVKSGFVVTFYRPDAKLAQVTAGKDAELGKTREKTREKLLSLIQANPRVTTIYLSKALSITSKGVEWNLKKLREEGSLKRIGPDKGGHWEVVTR